MIFRALILSLFGMCFGAFFCFAQQELNGFNSTEERVIVSVASGYDSASSVKYANSKCASNPEAIKLISTRHSDINILNIIAY